MTCGDSDRRTVESCPDRTSHRENPGFTALRRYGVSRPPRPNST